MTSEHTGFGGSSMVQARKIGCLLPSPVQSQLNQAYQALGFDSRHFTLGQMAPETFPQVVWNDGKDGTEQGWYLAAIVTTERTQIAAGATGHGGNPGN